MSFPLKLILQLFHCLFTAFSLVFHGLFTCFFHGSQALGPTGYWLTVEDCWGISQKHTSLGTNHHAFLRPSHCVYIQIRCGVLPRHIQWCFLSTLGSGNHGGYDSFPGLYHAVPIAELLRHWVSNGAKKNHEIHGHMRSNNHETTYQQEQTRECVCMRVHAIDTWRYMYSKHIYIYINNVK